MIAIASQLQFWVLRDGSTFGPAIQPALISRHSRERGNPASFLLRPVATDEKMAGFPHARE
jgi:hypothetical protein